MLVMGVLVGVVRQAGSVYQVLAVLKTTVPVTGGNYVGARHSNKNKRDRTKKSTENTQRKNLHSSTHVIRYIAA